MKTRLFSLLAIVCLPGCVSVPVYFDYTGPDAASLSGSGKPSTSTPAQASAGLLAVDSQPIPGNRFDVNAPVVHVTPGAHWISAFTQAPHVTNYTVSINATAQHAYRFDVDADANLTLWDITAAPALVTQFAPSDEGSQSSYYVASLWDADTNVADEPPIYDEVGGGGRGPDHPGDGHPTPPDHDHPAPQPGHSGGGGGSRPPPIPHAPRPPSGGHSGGGGGHSSGGGGGGRSGGGGGGGGGGHKK